jgi:hypothetical protein
LGLYIFSYQEQNAEKVNDRIEDALMVLTASQQLAETPGCGDSMLEHP